MCNNIGLVVSNKKKSCLPFFILHYLECGPLGLAMDNTGSGAGIMKFALELVDGLKGKGTAIPSWTLTTFNDVDASIAFEDIASENVEHILSTDNVDTLRESMATKVKFSGGGDGPERATQGNLVKNIDAKLPLVSQVFCSQCKTCPLIRWSSSLQTIKQKTTNWKMK